MFGVIKIGCWKKKNIYTTFETFQNYEQIIIKPLVFKFLFFLFDNFNAVNISDKLKA